MEGNIMWKFPLDIMLDITTRCNAGCPQCHRTDPMGLNKASWLPDINWSIEQFKQALPEKIAKHIYNFDFCGTWGDCLTNQDMLPIVKYIREVAPEATININTNGSLRNEDFWWELGVAGGKNLSITFAIEGTTQKMHQQYRQFTFLDKILNNMDIISNTPARIRTQCLVWKHNENHLDEIEQMCIEHGSLRHHVVATDRFGREVEYKFSYKGKEDKLEKTEIDFKDEEYSKQLDRRRFIKQTTKMSVNKKEVIEKIKKKKEVMKIVCEWGGNNKVVINPDGQVLPCCFFCNPHFFNKNSPEVKSWFIEHPIMQKYQERQKEYNVFSTNLIDIINSEWYQKTLPDSWKTDKPVYQCQKYCGKCYV